jgi:hypothetical protein
MSIGSGDGILNPDLLAISILDPDLSILAAYFCTSLY